MLRIENLNAGYGKLHVLFDVNVTINGKEITVMVGPNGSGKSTLLKTIFGLTRVYSGGISLEGQSLVGLPPHEVARMGVAYLPQTDNIFSNLRIRENLTMAGYMLNKMGLQDRVEEVVEIFPVLKEHYERSAGTLSGGERQMLAMAMALIKKPKIMLFDEPTANLAPKIATQVLRQIVSLRDDHNITVVLAEQNARKALEQGDRALLLVGGQLIFEGGADELLNHSELTRLYLGIKSTNE